MAMVCPQCHGSFDQKLECPTCGIRLLFQANVSGRAGTFADEHGQWQQTPWGRMLVGLILAQGLAHGLQLLVSAGVWASSEEAGRSVWATLFGLLLLEAIQGTSLLVGGAITGAGQVKGLQYAGPVGLVNGLIFLLWQRATSDALPEIALYAQPFVHMVFGALGGHIGMRIWKPLPSIQVPELEMPKRKRPTAPSRGILDGRIHWVRVAMGTVLVIGGVVWSNGIRDWVVDASQGELKIRTQLQARLVSWEIAALAALLGAALAGATTFNGLKQGLCVGLIASVLIMGIHLSSPGFVLETTIFTLASTLCLTLAGGWFGGQLFPPIVIRRRKNLTMV